MNQFQRLTGASRVFRKTILIYLSKSVTIVDMFLCQEMDLLHIFNIVKDITHDLIKDMFKTTMQSLKVQVFCYKIYRIGNIILENVSSYNLNVALEVKSS